MNMETGPEIGTTAAAVASCVSVLSAVTGQREEIMSYWLDLYYQVRCAHERAKAAIEAEAAAEVSKMGTKRFLEDSLKESAKRITARLQEELDVPETSAEAAEKLQALYQTDQISIPTKPAPLREKAQPEPDPPPKNRVGNPGGKGKPRPSRIGNTSGHDAAVFKRQVRDRLEAVRTKGVSTPEIIKAAPAGSMKESDIYMILQGHVIKIDIYRALDEALRHFEN